MRTRVLIPLLAACALTSADAAIDLASPSGRRAFEERVIGATNETGRAALEAELLAAAATDDEAAALFAAQQLAVLGGPATVPALAPWLARPDRVHAACMALTPNPSPAAGAALLAALDKTAGAARIQIMHSLARRGETAAAPTLAKLARDADPATASAARATLAVLPGRAARTAFAALPATAPELQLERAQTDRDARTATRLMEAGQPIHVRRGALATILALEPGDAPDRIEQVLRKGDTDLAPAAIAPVAHLPGPGTSRRFARLLPTLPPAAQACLVAALADRGDDDGRAAVRNALASPEPVVRGAAIAALQQTADTAAVTNLLLALARADNEEAREIEAAVAGLPAAPSIDGALVRELLIGDSPKPRVIRLLARRETPGIVPILLAQLGLRDPEVTKAALEAAGQLASADDLPELLALIRRVEGAEAAAARALGRADSAAAARALQDAIAANGLPEVRAALLRLLSRTPSPATLQVLVSYLQEADPAIRDATVRALADWPDAAAWPHLASVYAHTSEAAHRGLTLRALVRLANQPADLRATARIAALFKGAANDEERRQILGALAACREPEALALLAPLRAHPEIQAEVEAARAALVAPPPNAKSLFDGKTLAGWEGDTAGTWRVENGSIVAGALDRLTKENQYLATTAPYGDFELLLQYRLTGTEGFVNGGIQFRSERRPHPEGMAGYQADLGAGYDGALYDEHRRNKVLARPAEDVRKATVIPDGWNHYRIRAEGPRVRLWLNGVLTVDYTEPDDAIARRGLIAVQIHGGAKAKVEYRDLHLVELGR